MFKPFVDSIMNFFTNPLKVLGDFFKPLTDLFKPVTDFFGKGLTDFITSASAFFSDPLKVLGDFFKPLTDLFKPLTDFITKDMLKFFTKDLPEIIKPMSAFFGDIGKTVTGSLSTIFAWGRADATGDMSALMPSLSNFFTAGIKAQSTPAMIGMLGNAMEAVTSGLGHISKLFFEGVDVLQKGASALPTFFSDLIGHMLFTPYASIMGEFAKKYKGKVPTQLELMDSLGTATMGAVFSPYIISALMRWVGQSLRFTLGIKPMPGDQEGRYPAGQYTKKARPIRL
jgi:hypothetical protein